MEAYRSYLLAVALQQSLVKILAIARITRPNWFDIGTTSRSCCERWAACRKRKQCFARRSTREHAAEGPTHFLAHDGNLLVCPPVSARCLLNGRTDEAATHLGRAQGLLRKLAREFPLVPQYPLELASVEYNLGYLAMQTKHPDQAVASYRESVRLLEELKRRFPASPAYRMKLAVSQLALGQTLAATKPADAEDAVRKSLKEQSTLLAEYPDVWEYQVAVGRGHYQLGLILIASKPAEKTVLEAEKARDPLNVALKARPGSELVKGYLLDNQVLLGQALIRAGRLPEAMATAEQLPALVPRNPNACVHAAGLLIACARAAADTDDGRKLTEEALVRAVGVIRNAIQAKVIQSKATLDSKDLAPLRERDDFKGLGKLAARCTACILSCITSRANAESDSDETRRSAARELGCNEAVSSPGHPGPDVVMA